MSRPLFFIPPIFPAQNCTSLNEKKWKSFGKIKFPEIGITLYQKCLVSLFEFTQQIISTFYIYLTIVSSVKLLEPGLSSCFIDYSRRISIIFFCRDKHGMITRFLKKISMRILEKIAFSR